MYRRSLALLALLALAPAAQGSVYKCLLDDGRVFYQDTPCAPGRELRDFDKDPANVSVVPFTQPARVARPPVKAARPKSERTTAKSPEIVIKPCNALDTSLCFYICI